MASPKTVFCFAGQGYVPIKAARDLFRTSPVFKNSISDIDHIIDVFNKESERESTFVSLESYLQEEEIRPAYIPPFDIRDKEERSNSTSLTTPPATLVIFASQYALAQVIQSYGVSPTDIVGYSLGEHVASMVTGSLPLEIGIKLLLQREPLLADRELIPKKGGMLTVQACPAEVTSVLAKSGNLGTVEISGFPHPKSTILSGEATALDTLEKILDGHGIDHQRRNITFGMHSSHVGKVANTMREDPEILPNEAATEAYVRPGIKHWSNISGARLPESAPLNANYWATQLTTSIHFKQCIEGIHKDAGEGGEAVYLDLGMGPRLTRLVQNTLQDSNEWKAGSIKAISCVATTSTDSSEMEKEGWASRTLEKSLQPLIGSV